MVILKKLTKIGKTIRKHNENFNKELEHRKGTTQMDTITEMKNTLEEINRRLDAKEKYIRGLEDRIVEITQSKEQKEKKN